MSMPKSLHHRDITTASGFRSRKLSRCSFVGRLICGPFLFTSESWEGGSQIALGEQSVISFVEPPAMFREITRGRSHAQPGTRLRLWYLPRQYAACCAERSSISIAVHPVPGQLRNRRLDISCRPQGANTAQTSKWWRLHLVPAVTGMPVRFR